MARIENQGSRKCEVKAEVCEAGEQRNEGQEEVCVQTTLVDGDQEVWVRNTILTAMRAALLVNQCRTVRADEEILSGAFDGIANGAAVEVLNTLGLKPSYTNLRRPRGLNFIGSNVL